MVGYITENVRSLQFTSGKEDWITSADVLTIAVGINTTVANADDEGEPETQHLPTQNATKLTAGLQRHFMQEDNAWIGNVFKLCGANHSKEND